MKKNETRIAIFYPWTGLPALDRGSARRVVPLVNLLAENYAEVKVLSPGNLSAIGNGNIEYLFIHPTPSERAVLRLIHWLYDGVLYHLSRGQITPRERRQWWQYLSVRLQPSLTKGVQELVAWSSIALLEFPFWESAVRAACRTMSKNYLLTLHDVLPDLMTSNHWLMRRVRAGELRASRDAASVFSVSLHDQQRFEENGIATRVIPHGMETEPHRPKLVPPKSPEFQALEKAHAQGATVCLFIGSSLRCNTEAVQTIQKIAKAVAMRGDVRFIVAGACLGKGNYADKITAFGPVEESLLLKLYE
ncbi:MAG TPA: hypothetical protein VIS99_07095, partial [Terrimicrobiaceae bacterium]